MSITFVIDSDLHFRDAIRSDKSNNVNRLINLAKNEKIDVVLCPGDLTQDGMDGRTLFGKNIGGNEKQLQNLINQYVKPVEKDVAPVYLCQGNHDGDNNTKWYQPVLFYVAKKNGLLFYRFRIDELNFICLGRYPTKIAIYALKYYLWRIGKEKPIFFFWHYNMEGFNGDWWSEEDKKRFFKTIEGYNVVGISVGHWHITQVTSWNNIPVYMGAGAQMMKCVYDKKTQKITGTPV